MYVHNTARYVVGIMREWPKGVDLRPRRFQVMCLDVFAPVISLNELRRCTLAPNPAGEMQ